MIETKMGNGGQGVRESVVWLFLASGGERCRREYLISRGRGRKGGPNDDDVDDGSPSLTLFYFCQPSSFVAPPRNTERLEGYGYFLRILRTILVANVYLETCFEARTERRRPFFFFPAGVRYFLPAFGSIGGAR